MKILKSGMVILFALTLVLTSQMGAYAQSKAGKPIVLKYGQIFTENHTDGKATVAWVDKIEKETNGRVKIQVFWGATLINPREGWEQIRSGLADIGHSVPSYMRVGFNIARGMMGFIYGVPTLDMADRIYTELRSKFPEIDKEFETLKVLAYSTASPYHLVTRKPVRKLEDLRGLSLKAAPLFIPALKELGAEGSFIPMVETYIALEKGIVDGMFASYEAIKAFKFNEVAKYCTSMNIVTMPCASKEMNLNTWKRLPRDVQKIFNDNIAWYGQELHRQTTAADQGGLKFGKEQGVEFIKLPAADLNRFYNLLEKGALKKAAELDAKGLPGTKMFKETRRLIEKYTK
ncbi:TRAP transporter substrate-binding protein [Thermodesulfobacteriota bacterium]